MRFSHGHCTLVVYNHPPNSAWAASQLGSHWHFSCMFCNGCSRGFENGPWEVRLFCKASLSVFLFDAFQQIRDTERPSSWLWVPDGSWRAVLVYFWEVPWIWLLEITDGPLPWANAQQNSERKYVPWTGRAQLHFPLLWTIPSSEGLDLLSKTIKMQ